MQPGLGSTSFYWRPLLRRKKSGSFEDEDEIDDSEHGGNHGSQGHGSGESESSSKLTSGTREAIHSTSSSPSSPALSIPSTSHSSRTTLPGEGTADPTESSTSTSPPDLQSSESQLGGHSSDIHSGALAGIVVSTACILLLLTAASILCFRARRRSVQRGRSSLHTSDTESLRFASLAQYHSTSAGSSRLSPSESRNEELSVTYPSEKGSGPMQARSTTPSTSSSTKRSSPTGLSPPASTSSSRLSRLRSGLGMGGLGYGSRSTVEMSEVTVNTSPISYPSLSPSSVMQAHIERLTAENQALHQQVVRQELQEPPPAYGQD